MENECVSRVIVYGDETSIVYIQHCIRSIKGYTLCRAGREAIEFRIRSDWTPPLKYLLQLMTDYCIYFMKCEWTSENGQAGIWISEPAKAIGAAPHCKLLEWDDWPRDQQEESFSK
jgi:hypothetical protein